MLSTSDTRDVSLMAKDQYMREVWGMERLTQEEENQLIERVYRGRCERINAQPNQWVLNLAKHARDRLVQEYQPVVISVAKRFVFRFKSMDLMDLVQEGNIGLLAAIEQNDPTKGLPLRVLVFRYVRSALWKALRDRDRMVGVTAIQEEALLRMKRVQSQLMSALGREATVSELATEMGVSEPFLCDLREIDREECTSLNGLLREADAGEVLNFVGLYHSSVAAEDARLRHLEEAVSQAVEMRLTARQREVVRLRYGLDGQCLTQVDVASHLGLTHSTAVREEYRAKDRLREALSFVYGIAQEELSA